MKIFDSKHIKNIVLLGAAKSGKTTLAETMLFEAGLINRRGTVEGKNTISDYHEIEHERFAASFRKTHHRTDSGRCPGHVLPDPLPNGRPG